ncbi:ABC8A protein, partial [Pitta sordida]|nr:ABC8A protein [Pitta sordida]
ALVDVPLFWTLMCLMFGILVLFMQTCPLQASSIPPLIICIIGYGMSLVLLVYLIAFKFRGRRSNRYIWSLLFILVNYPLYMFSDYHKAIYYTAISLIPVFPPLGWM